MWSQARGNPWLPEAAESSEDSFANPILAKIMSK